MMIQYAKPDLQRKQRLLELQKLFNELSSIFLQPSKLNLDEARYDINMTFIWKYAVGLVFFPNYVVDSELWCFVFVFMKVVKIPFAEFNDGFLSLRFSDNVTPWAVADLWSGGARPGGVAACDVCHRRQWSVWSLQISSVGTDSRQHTGSGGQSATTWARTTVSSVETTSMMRLVTASQGWVLGTRVSSPWISK